MTVSEPRRRLFGATAAVLVAIFLASVARFYHPRTGFTPLIGFQAGHAGEVPALRALPHADSPAMGAYDGQYYAQLALVPLLRDPAIDRAMDLASFRARRILFSWTAWGLGLGRPAWILEAYALQNVLCWLILAGALTRWIPPTSGRRLALWTACLFSHGLLWSVRFALLDGPSLLLTACAIVAAEQRRPLLSAGIGGIEGLGRETNLLAALAQPAPSGTRGWLRLAAAMVLIVLPLLVWEDYLYSIYRTTIVAGADELDPPGIAIVLTWAHVLGSVRSHGLPPATARSLCILLALAAQALYLAWRREYAQPWWRVAAGYAALMLLLDRELADPNTGAITRVLLPLTVGFNVLLARETHPRHFWPWFVVGNLHLIPALWVMPLL